MRYQFFKMLLALLALAFWWPYRGAGLVSCLPWIAASVLWNVVLYLLFYPHRARLAPPGWRAFVATAGGKAMLFGNLAVGTLRLGMAAINLAFLLQDKEPHPAFIAILAGQQPYQDLYGLALLAAVTLGFLVLLARPVGSSPAAARQI